ncbi:MAG: hypothetical protein JNN17_04680 [Verrucomicrobiaceae bacterium]|mgnify:FL=1|jgi:hypothetical protein|nr:hypothetical protein [Verrucomicrobiaceae bacterium]
MYKRIIYENWHAIIPLLAFATTGVVFAVMTIRGMLLRKEKSEHMSHLPLDD